jgi:TonB family protein
MKTGLDTPGPLLAGKLPCQPDNEHRGLARPGRSRPVFQALALLSLTGLGMTGCASTPGEGGRGAPAQDRAFHPECEGPARTAVDLEPWVTNREEVSRILVRTGPETTRGAGEAGRVALVCVSLSESGASSGIRLAESSGHALADEVALQAVRAMAFLPAERAGVPVAVRWTMPVTFRARR